MPVEKSKSKYSLQLYFFMSSPLYADKHGYQSFLICSALLFSLETPHTTTIIYFMHNAKFYNHF